MQSVYTLQYGAGLALTTSKYYTPAGRNIQRDYSSFYDYYMADERETRRRPAERARAVQDRHRAIVYGGGGITPDVIVKPAQLSRTTQLLEVRSAIFNYAVEYAAEASRADQGPPTSRRRSSRTSSTTPRRTTSLRRATSATRCRNPRTASTSSVR